MKQEDLYRTYRIISAGGRKVEFGVSVFCDTEHVPATYSLEWIDYSSDLSDVPTRREEIWLTPEEFREMVSELSDALED